MCTWRSQVDFKEEVVFESAVEKRMAQSGRQKKEGAECILRKDKNGMCKDKRYKDGGV